MLMSMLRCMLGSVKGVKSENPKGKGEIRQFILLIAIRENPYLCKVKC